MRAVSIYQPWASLLVAGVKRYETRSWQTRHRGPIAVHAALTFPPAARALCGLTPFREALRAAGHGDWPDLPRGAVLGVAELVRCVRVEEMGPAGLGELERRLGDFRPGRWAWEIVHPAALPAPVPFTGRGGVFHFPEELLP